MNLFLCLLGPSLLSIKIFNNLNDNELSNKNIIFNYFLFVFFNNLICTVFSTVVLGGKTSVDASLINLPIFAIKYVVVSIIIAIILPFFVQLINKNIKYNVEVKENEKYKKNVKNKKNN